MSLRNPPLTASLACIAVAAMLFSPGCIVVTTPLDVNAGTDSSTTTGTTIALLSIVSGGTGSYQFQWTPTTDLNDPFSATPFFTPTTVGDHTFTLHVTDSSGQVASDSVTIHVTSSHSPLIANAGPNLDAPINVATTLQGSASGGSGGYTFSWSPTTGVSDAHIAQPTFTPTAVANTVFTLTVTDSEGSTATDTVSVNAFVGTTLSTLTWAANATAGYQLLATFSDDLDSASAQTPSNYRDHASNTTATIAALQPDQRTVLITFTNVALASSSTFDIGVGADLKDANDHGIPAVGQRPADANPADITAPTVLTRKWGANAGTGYTVIVQFSEAMDRLTTQDTSTYRLNGIASPQTAAVSGDGQSVTLTFTNVAVSPSATLDVGVGGSVHDMNGQLLATSTGQAIAVNATDLTVPTVVSAQHAAQFTSPGYQITVRFNEAMSAIDVQNPAGYRVNGFAATTATLATDAQSVTLVFMTPIATGDQLNVGASGTVKDINGNAVAPIDVAIIANAADVVGPTIASRVWDADASSYQVLVTYNESVDRTTATTTTNYSVQTAGGMANPTVAVLGNDGKTVTLTFTATGSGLSHTDTIAVTSGVHDINGQANTSTSAASITASATDAAAPTITNRVWAVNSTQYKVLLTFSEVLDRATAINPTNYQIQGNSGVDLRNPSVAALDTTGRIVTLTFSTTTAGFVIGDTVSASSSVLDINSKANGSTAPVAINANAGDTTPPAVSSFARVDATHANVVFSEVMDKATVEAAAYTITGGGSVTAKVLQADGRTVRLTTSADPTGETITIPTTVRDINNQAPASSLSAGPF